MSIPILHVEGFLIVELQGELKDADIAAVQQSLLEQLHRERARGVLIDLSGLEVVDSYTGRVIRDTAGMVRLMGARTAVVGLRPAVAITLVEMGLELPGVHMDLNLERGLEWLRAPER
ncbi:STAS domain-containing protein [Limnochorda pilosa]|uniref:Anti-sigma factor antagonist n=1 Tax=Limnochorda pilosa TaxID=1555112 RepID=A0A0K2SKV8_LIMPI|nr:STAS domain-containing protein [Limnochorda pilosa]BAS27746.1 anti-sigma factor antagonist [Limnochorda pilosa]